MYRKFSPTLFILLIIFLLGLERAQACSCARNPSPVVGYKSAPIVFIGSVKSIREEKTKINHFGVEREARIGLAAYFDVEEAFKGLNQKQATVFTGGGGGDCGYSFRVGERYLIFAFPLKENSGENIIAATVFGNSEIAQKNIVGAAMTTNICTLTNAVKSVPDQLAMIRAFLKGKPEPRIYGSISEYVYNFDGGISPHYVGAMSGVGVVADGRNGRLDAKTDENGKFSIINPPVGKYTVKFLLPATHTVLWDWEKPTAYPVEIKTAEDAAELNLAAQILATIGGTVFDSRGRPVGGDVQLSLIPLEFADKPISDLPHRSEYTKENGKYLFDGVKPGKYVLGVNVAEAPAKNTPYPKTYFPSGGDRSTAKVIEISIGQKLNDFDFRLPKQLEKFAVSGKAVSSDGKAVAGADVNIFDIETPNESVFGFSDDVKTDARGNFTIVAFKNRRYLLHAYKDEDYLAGKGVQSERVEVVFDETAKNVKLVLNKSGIFINQLK